MNDKSQNQEWLGDRAPAGAQGVWGNPDEKLRPSGQYALAAEKCLDQLVFLRPSGMIDTGSDNLIALAGVYARLAQAAAAVEARPIPNSDRNMAPPTSRWSSRHG